MNKRKEEQIKVIKYKFPSDSSRLRGTTLFTRIFFSAEIVGIFKQLYPRTGTLYDCSLFIQEFREYTNTVADSRKIDWVASHTPLHQPNKKKN